MRKKVIIQDCFTIIMIYSRLAPLGHDLKRIVQGVGVVKVVGRKEEGLREK